MTTVGGPFFDDLTVGQRFENAPSLTLTSGHAALHQAILGDRLRLALDAELAARVIGAPAPLAHPALICDVAIGQSTLVTQRVIANLFYRGLVLHRGPVIGDTLSTSTEVVALRQTSSRPGRAATGLAALRVRTVDQAGHPVLDFVRCAMLPVRDPRGSTDHDDDLDAIPADLDLAAAETMLAGWKLDELHHPRSNELAPGQRLELAGGDVVSSAPELARLSLNVAMAHHDAGANASGRRLVYGGHTIGIAAAQATRAIPELVTIVAWHACDHLAPVFEGDTLRSSVEVEALTPLAAGGTFVHLRSRVDADREDGPVDVLDWRFVAVLA
jgi:acyl dehydratase